MEFRHKSYLLGAILFALLITKGSLAQTFQWAKASAGNSTVQASDIATDNLGNSYVTGEFNGTLILGSDTLISAIHYTNGPELFVAKFAPDGTVLWLVKASGPNLEDNCQGESIDLDASGNAYITGYYRNKAGFGLDTITSIAANSNVFIAKIDPNGNWLWTTTAGADNLTAGTDIAVAANGSLYVGGYFYDTTDFNGDAHISAGMADLFIAQYDNLGNYQWSRKLGGVNLDAFGGISTDAANAVYITGSFDSLATIGPFNLVSNGLKDVFVAKYDYNGNALWARQYGSSDEDQGLGIANDAWGNIYFTGRFRGLITFGSTTLTSSGVDDFYLVKSDIAGNVIWARRGGGPNFATTTDIAIGLNGQPIITGFYSDTLTVGSNQLINNDPNGTSDPFVSKFDTAGTVIWTHDGGSTSGDVSEAISIDGMGNAYITGTFNLNAMFDDHEVVSGGLVQVFTAKLNDWLLTTNVSGLVQCANPPITVDYLVNGTFNAGNIFSAELSDANGMFGAPVPIGSVSSTVSGSINCSIPSNTPSGFYKIRVVASNAVIIGSSFEVLLPITIGPPNQTILPNDTVYVCGSDSVELFTINESGVTYQWFLNSTPIAGATGVSLWATPPGSYSFTASNVCGNTSSGSIEVISTAAPNATIIPGGPVNFCPSDSVLLSGVPAIGASYQWFENGNPILGGTMLNLSAQNASTYTLNVTTACGSSTSAPINVTYLPLPNAAVTATGPTVICQGDTVPLLATNGVGSTFQWLQNATPIGGATDTVYNALQAGQYTLEVTNSCGTAFSNTIVVSISPDPISIAFTSGVLPMCINDSVLLESNSSNVVGYQWLLDGAPISGATNGTFYANAEGNYSLVTSNDCGADTSTMVAVAIDTGCTAAVHDWEALFRPSVFPNPTAGSIQVAFENSSPEKVRLSLIDLQGRIVLSGDWTVVSPNNSLGLDGQTLAAGLYHLRVESNLGIWVEKVVIR